MLKKSIKVGKMGAIKHAEFIVFIYICYHFPNKATNMVIIHNMIFQYINVTLF